MSIIVKKDVESQFDRDTDSQNGDALLCIYYINFMYSTMF